MLRNWRSVAHGPLDLAIRCRVEGCGVQVGWQHLTEDDDREAWARRLARNPGVTCEQCYRAEAQHRAALAHRAEVAARGEDPLTVLDPHAERAEAYLRWYHQPDVVADRREATQKAHFTTFFCMVYSATAKLRTPLELAFFLGFARWSWLQMDRATRRRTLEAFREVKLEVRERIAALTELVEVA